MAPRRADALQKLLIIVHGSTVSDRAIAELAARGIDECASTEGRAVWFASLIGADPDQGIPRPRAHLDRLDEPTDRTRSGTRYRFVEFAETLERTPRDHRELAELVLLRFLDLKAELEGGDESMAPVLLRIEEETEMRNFLARELRSRAHGRYDVPQESELADGKRPDLRFHGSGFDAPVPAELKLADRWTGPKLLERLENQLCGDYLRDPRSRRGLFVLVHNGTKKAWTVGDGDRVDFEGLVEALAARWRQIAPSFPDIDDVRVVGINLPLRTRSATNGGYARRPPTGTPSEA